MSISGRGIASNEQAYYTSPGSPCEEHTTGGKTHLTLQNGEGTRLAMNMQAFLPDTP